jgi:hypothetical protein
MGSPSVLFLATKRVAAVAADSNRNAKLATPAAAAQVVDLIEPACARLDAGEREFVMGRARRYDNPRRTISGNPRRA